MTQYQTPGRSGSFESYSSIIVSITTQLSQPCKVPEEILLSRVAQEVLKLLAGAQQKSISRSRLSIFRPHCISPRLTLCWTEVHKVLDGSPQKTPRQSTTTTFQRSRFLWWPWMSANARSHAEFVAAAFRYGRGSTSNRRHTRGGPKPGPKPGHDPGPTNIFKPIAASLSIRYVGQTNRRTDEQSGRS